MSLIPRFEDRFDVGNNIMIRFEETFRGRTSFDAATGQIEESVAAGFVMKGMMSFGWYGPIKSLQVEYMRSCPLSCFYCTDNALQQERVGDTDDEGIRGASINAHGNEIGLHRGIC